MAFRFKITWVTIVACVVLLVSFLHVVDAVPPCVDKVASCETYQADTCYASKYRSWAGKHCRRYCRLCTAAQLRALDSSSHCKDRKKDCKLYPKGSCGGKYIAWAKRNCIATCGYCKHRG